MSAEAPIKVLLAKPGLDGHDVGVKVVASALRDAGMEVIYLGLRQTAQQIVTATLEEDVDVIGLSFHSLIHEAFISELMNLLKEKNATGILVIAGGSILKTHAQNLKPMGVAEVFGVETPTQKIVNFIRENVKPKRGH